MNKVTKVLNELYNNEGDIVMFPSKTKEPVKPNETENKSEAPSREELIKVLKSLKKDDKIEITHKIDNSGSPLKKTVATVMMSDEDVELSYKTQGYTKTKTSVYITVKKGGGAIYDYGDKEGILWQPTMLTQVKPVIDIKKI